MYRSNSRSKSQNTTFAQAVKAGHQIGLCSIALHELWCGAFRGGYPERNRGALEIFLNGITVLEFDDEDAQAAGEIRARLAKAGKSIGPFNTLIAAQALRRKLIVATGNISEFKRVPGLFTENWTK